MGVITRTELLGISIALLLLRPRILKECFEHLLAADVLGLVVAFVDAEVVLAGELVFGVVAVLVFLDFEVADALAGAVVG